MLAYRAISLMIALAAMLVVGACQPEIPSGNSDTLDPDRESQTEIPERPEPTSIPSGGLFTIDGAPVRQVVLWDPELPAEYAATQRYLYRREHVDSWSRVGNLPIQGHVITDPDNADRLFVGDHPPCLHEAEPISLHVSLNGGSSWRAMPQAQNIRPLTILPEDTDIIIGSRCGLTISTDRGRTWEMHVPDAGFDLTYLTYTQIGLYGIFTSESETSHLRRIELDSDGNPTFESPILTFWGGGAVHATQERILVAETRGVHFSDDGGRTWTFTNKGLEDVVTTVDPFESPIPADELERGIGLNAVLPVPGDAQRIFVGSVRGLYLSEDGGQTWGKVDEIEDVNVQHLQFAIGGTLLYVTTERGVVILHNP